MIRAGIVGGTGYTGAELLRLLMAHPEVEVVAVTSRQEAGRPVSELHPGLRGYLELEYREPADAGLEQCDVVFFATPHAAAMHAVPALLDARVRVVDLSADFRLRDAELWARWYGEAHACPELLEEAVYGLPELNREALHDAQLVACPGCYPTAIVLGFLPLVEAGLVDPATLVADAVTGVSGAGRKASVAMLHGEVSESFRAYGVAGHRHLPEISAVLQGVSAAEVGLVFVPHLVPMNRGIHATLHARLDGSLDLTDLQAAFERRYQGEPCVDVMPPGSLPETRSVRGSNMCRVAVHQPPGQPQQVVVLSVIDNLVKGASGQAVQNMNLMFGLDETLGLVSPGMLP